MRAVMLCLAVFSTGTVFAQSGPVAPATCNTGDKFYLTLTGGGVYLRCAGTNFWTPTLAPGLLYLSLAACPTGFVEVAGVNGKMLRGTVAANGNVGQSGGSDSVTPTFTGSAWSAPAIAWPVGVPTFTGSAGTVPAQTFTGSSATSSAVSAGTPAGTNGASGTSGNCAATNIAAGTGSTTACKATAPNLTVTAQTFTGSALSTHTHTVTATGTNGTAAFTPAGTVAWPGGVPTLGAYTPIGTISAVDTRAGYLNVIVCQQQ